METLAEPLGRLRFAGEATARGPYATMNGALRSGLRETQRLDAGASLPGYRAAAAPAHALWHGGPMRERAPQPAREQTPTAIAPAPRVVSAPAARAPAPPFASIPTMAPDAMVAQGLGWAITALGAPVVGGPPIQRVGGQKFGLEVTGDQQDATVQEGLVALKAAYAAYKAELQKKKSDALAAQKVAAAAAKNLVGDDQIRAAQIQAQTVLTGELAAAEMTPPELVQKAGADFALAAGVISYKGVEIARVRAGAAAYQQTKAGVGGLPSVYKRHTLDGLSDKEYVDTADGKFLRRQAFRGVTPPEQRQLAAGQDLVPLNAAHRDSAELGFNFDAGGQPVARGVDKGTDLALLNQKAGTNLAQVPANAQVRAYLQVRKGVGKYFSARSTPKPITSNHDQPFDEHGEIAIDLAKVPQAELLHHYKSTLSAQAISDAAGNNGAPPAALTRDVQRGNESVTRNRELVIGQIPHAAVTAVGADTRAAFEAAFPQGFALGVPYGWQRAITQSGLPFGNGVVYGAPALPVPATPHGFGQAAGTQKGRETGEAAGAAAAAAVVQSGQAFVRAYGDKYREAYSGERYGLAYDAAFGEDFPGEKALTAFDREQERLPVPATPELHEIPPEDEQAAALAAIEAQGRADAAQAFASANASKSKGGRGKKPKKRK